MKELWTTLRQLLPILPSGARRYFIGYVLATTAITALDAVAMGLLAIVIGPAMAGNSMKLPIIGEVGPDAAPVITIIAVALIILKSTLAILLHWLATRKFATYEQEIGDRLFSAYINSSWEERSKRTVAEITRIADHGIAFSMANFILPIARVPGLFFTFIAVLAVLLFADPMTSIIAFAYLGLVAYLIHSVVTKRALRAGDVNLDYTYRVANLMTEMIDALKELSLRNRLGQVADLVSENRTHAVRARANISFLSIVPGFAFEAALIGGVILIGAAAYLFQGGMAAALAAVALFAATGFRLIPALTGMQASLVQAGQGLAMTKDVIGDLTSTEQNMQSSQMPADTAVLAATPDKLTLSDVSFRYPEAQQDVIQHMSLAIPLGSSMGIVGPSGAGKSTLIDLLLGLSQPSDGSITIDGVPLRSVLQQWRGRVGYVPQRVALFDGTIAQNVALTWNDDVDRDRVVEALERAQLGSLISDRGDGIDERIGERGVSLSGGQQQRLGIARALYSDPLVLVLDEATSSLDTKTEDEVTKSIQQLRGEVTLISVAHRLSTIKEYDRVCYLDGGTIVAQGTFSEVARTVPAFGEQVRLAGLGGDVQWSGETPER
ncbi:ABC transporter ATP-binding protein/permease [Leucobacter rhizosphaerae]|uniref:ABC transporter ATP-binding protein/permease n=1 Tax=Leucobacter rhizosphaerae TaxID=2932245 RepID=A0ABY4FUE9_9MICO|nr:ABC transporter ATP-binding protein [Leucobacter rhizosphaerae]UOQ59931.1 ABC transporter ATP-binding protein/permease [Leucobacter rhizosphaerae]